jgi:5-formyltetrahydrofolate cyclo-ligase
MNKSDIRELYKQKRLKLGIQELEQISEQVCNNVLSNFQLEGKTCSLFLPIERLREINTYSLLERGVSIGARMVLPRCEDNFRLKHYLFENHKQLKTSILGIPEPQSGKLIPIKDIDIVFVPLLAFDATGQRVGYGKGYYDRFLKKCRPDCTFIGLHLFDEHDVISDCETTDVALHYCVGPSKIHRFAK